METFGLTIAAIMLAGAPLVLATLGETLTEKAGIINLSLDGSILLAAMTAFVVSTVFDNPWLGVLAGMSVGAAIAGILVLSVSISANHSWLSAYSNTALSRSGILPRPFILPPARSGPRPLEDSRYWRSATHRTYFQFTIPRSLHGTSRHFRLLVVDVSHRRRHASSCGGRIPSRSIWTRNPRTTRTSLLLSRRRSIGRYGRCSILSCSQTRLGPTAGM